MGLATKWKYGLESTARRPDLRWDSPTSAPGTAVHSRILVPLRFVLRGNELAGCTLVQTTVITYSIWVPVALLVRDSQPAHQQGAFEILLSPQGHIMHSLNTGMGAPFCPERPAPLLRGC